MLAHSLNAHRTDLKPVDMSRLPDDPASPEAARAALAALFGDAPKPTASPESPAVSGTSGPTDPVERKIALLRRKREARAALMAWVSSQGYALEELLNAEDAALDEPGTGTDVPPA
jgi:hypothetical protein